ncbi:MAG: DUF4912 domain-containing protein [Candidatus Omnitrophica bacterium]|nr:DUF4912 domain-containing protein [Candidatus Omnitrophota bacterium]MBD3268961.1 DUF4912 domain-containing protein [Candidatus Omnitrophota bacterium]
MAKKRKVIKRVYEKGKETTVPSLKERSIRKIPQTVSSSPAHGQDNKQTNSPFVLEEKTDLPLFYGRDRLSLMVKDSFWIYAYWEINRESLTSLQKNIRDSAAGGERLILRMYDVTLKDFNGHNANHYFDIEIQDLTGERYINLWCDNVSYIGDIGLRNAEGKFFPLVRSNWVHTPRLRYSDRREQVWMKVEDNDDISGPEDAARSFVENKKYEVRLKNYPSPNEQSPKNKRNRFAHISEDEVRKYYERLNPFLWESISSAIAKRYAERYEDPTARILFTGKFSDKELVDIFSLFPQTFWGNMFLHSSDIFREGGSQQLQKKPLAENETSGSQALAENPLGRKFFFELNAEVVIYGRTEPDAAVNMNGERVHLRPDGTFTLRFSLPDGDSPFEFKAESGDKLEKREINTYIRRRTDYKNR